MLKGLILFALIGLTLSANVITFDEFITKFNKPYAKGTAEYAQKLKIFNYNVDILNNKNCSACGVTKFFDVAPADFAKNTLNLDIPDNKVSEPVAIDTGTLNKVGYPQYIDWRERGVITSIKDQGECGCCWSFATCALAESTLILKGKATLSVDLSEQYLLKCTPEGGCKGGYIEYAMKLAAAKGIPQESVYPYVPQKTQSGICQNTAGIKVTNRSPISYYDLTTDQIKSLLGNGPLAIAIDATNWQYYSSGVWSCDDSDQVNHAVLLVGYTADGKSWIVKNQWGADWGDNGYIYVSTARGSNCNIGTAVHLLFGGNFAVWVLGALAALLALMM